MEPGVALLIFFAVLVIALVLWRTQLLPGIFRTREERERTQIEDVLKQCFHVEYSGRSAGLNAMAGALKMSHKRLVKLIEMMSERNLIEQNNDHLQLTDEGRSYALQIVRIHRLWEKYLSERTGYDKKDWHGQAEKKEHLLTTEDADALYKDLGSPRYDPHGDPIPTSGGEIISTSWKPLSSLPPAAPARIIHIEDEPEVIYQQILATKLHIGSRVTVEQADESTIRLISEGKKVTLSPIVASNISVRELSDPERSEEQTIRLSMLAPGETGNVVGLSSECRGANRRRLMDLGFTRGSSILAEYASPMKEPKAYRIRNTLIALRNDQADLILIEKAS